MGDVDTCCDNARADDVDLSDPILYDLGVFVRKDQFAPAPLLFPNQIMHGIPPFDEFLEVLKRGGSVSQLINMSTTAAKIIASAWQENRFREAVFITIDWDAWKSCSAALERLCTEYNKILPKLLPIQSCKKCACVRSECGKFRCRLFLITSFDHDVWREDYRRFKERNDHGDAQLYVSTSGIHKQYIQDYIDPASKGSMSGPVCVVRLSLHYDDDASQHRVHHGLVNPIRLDFVDQSVPTLRAMVYQAM
jgi:hypothetical protein